MTKKWDIILHSDCPPERCFELLAEQVDIDEPASLPFSGYKGDRLILGAIAGMEFRLHRRHAWYEGNSFGPILFGRITVDGRGNLIEAYWGIWKSVGRLMRRSLYFAVPLAVVGFFASLYCVSNRSCTDKEGLWVGLAVPPALIFFFLFLPRIGWVFGQRDREYLTDFLARTIVAGSIPTAGESPRKWASSLGAAE